jgi:hypothetical protein
MTGIAETTMSEGKRHRNLIALLLCRGRTADLSHWFALFWHHNDARTPTTPLSGCGLRRSAFDLCCFCRSAHGAGEREGRAALRSEKGAKPGTDQPGRRTLSISIAIENFANLLGNRLEITGLHCVSY